MVPVERWFIMVMKYVGTIQSNCSQMFCFANFLRTYDCDRLPGEKVSVTLENLTRHMLLLWSQADLLSEAGNSLLTTFVALRSRSIYVTRTWCFFELHKNCIEQTHEVGISVPPVPGRLPYRYLVGIHTRHCMLNLHQSSSYSK